MRYVKKFNREYPEDTRPVVCTCAFCREDILDGDPCCYLLPNHSMIICKYCAEDNNIKAEEVA